MRKHSHSLPSIQPPVPLAGDTASEALRADLRAAITSLPFHTFEALICDLLQALGYGQIKLLDRKELRQPTRHGGLDLEATTKAGVHATAILVQVKQYKRPVSRRFVDELRGVLLRRGGQGLIVTTSTFSQVAHQVARSNQVLPIRLVEGEELLDLLIVHQIGIALKQEGGRLYLDENYLAELTRRFPSRSQKGGISSKKRKHQTERSYKAQILEGVGLRPGCAFLFSLLFRLAYKLARLVEQKERPQK